MNKLHWSIDVKGTLESVHMYLRYHRGTEADNEIGFGIELMPRKWKASHHKTMCRLNLFLWVIAFWFDYPYPIQAKTIQVKTETSKKAKASTTLHPIEDNKLYCLRCNKLNPDPKEDCWVGAKLFTQNPTPHIFK